VDLPVHDGVTNVIVSGRLPGTANRRG